MLYPILITASVGALTTIGAFFYGIDDGKKKERLKWEIANVEVLIQSNDNLAEVLKEKDGEFILAQEREADVTKDIGVKTNTITERIITVPVERVVTVEVPAECDSDNINISYDTIRLLNSWSEGDRLRDSIEESTTSDVPLVGASKVSRNFTED